MQSRALVVLLVRGLGLRATLTGLVGLVTQIGMEIAFRIRSRDADRVVVGSGSRLVDLLCWTMMLAPGLDLPFGATWLVDSLTREPDPPPSASSGEPH